ncbi:MULTISPECIES: hypothetical protein [unclassified Amycolatopsis]|nr:hypothetical protein [Amycolatopsis sp. CFH S0078]
MAVRARPRAGSIAAISQPVRSRVRINPRHTIELDASHASLASQPGQIADLIDTAARA